EGADYGQRAVGGAVHQVHLHGELGAAQPVLAGDVEVELDQVVALAVDGHSAARVVVHLDRVAVVGDVQVGWLVVEGDLAQRAAAGSDRQIDRRLAAPARAGGEGRVDLGPGVRTLAAFVGPMRTGRDMLFGGGVALAGGLVSTLFRGLVLHAGGTAAAGRQKR